MRRRDAYALIRAVIGDEVCPEIREISVEMRRIADSEGLDSSSCNQLHELADRLQPLVGTTTHQMRAALAGAIVGATEVDLKDCPACEEPVDHHNPKCHLQKLELL